MVKMSIYLYYNLTIVPNNEISYVNISKIKDSIKLENLKNIAYKDEQVYAYFAGKKYCPRFTDEFIHIYYVEYVEDNYSVSILFTEVTNTELITSDLVFNSESKALLTLFDRHIKIVNNFLSGYEYEYSYNNYLYSLDNKLSKNRFYNLTPYVNNNLKSKLFDYQLDNINWMFELERNPIEGIITSDKVFIFPENDGRIFNYTNSVFENNTIKTTKLKGGIIMDEVGIGKTLQFLCLASVNPQLKTLILVPDHLVNHWINQIKIHFYNELTNVTISSFSNYDSIILYDRVIVDEIHELYALPINRELFKLICNTKSQYKWGISATPFAAKHSIFNLLKYLTENNYTFPNMERATINYKIYEQMFRKNTLQNIVAEIELPDKFEHNILVNFNNDESIIYNAEVLAKENADINFLRKACCDVVLNFSNNNLSPIEFNNLVIDSFKNKYEEQIEKYKETNKMIDNCIKNIEEYSLLSRDTKQLEENLNHYTHNLKVIEINIINRKAAYDFLKKQIEETTECPICSCSINDVICYDVLPCHHIFCSSCSEAWLNRNNYKSCPYCRKEVNKEAIYRISNNCNKYSTKIIELINIINKTTEKFIIFTQYETLITKISNILSNEQIDNSIFKTQNDIDEFRNNNERVIILSSLNNASGLDFSFVNNLIIFEPISGTNTFLRDIEKQIIGRIYRIKQEIPINVYRIIVKNTIEEEIYKRALIFN